MMEYYIFGLILLIFSVMFFILSIYMNMFNISLFLEWSVYQYNSVDFHMLIFFDWMTLMFMFTIFFISSMIMYYCVEYMFHDNYKIRFFFLMFLFIMSMLMLVISPNLVSMLLGWDGLGLVSYCLVIYYQNSYSYTSGMVTILLNRIGDVMILISLSLMFIYGGWNFMNYNFLFFWMLFLILIASFTKSAQFPFSSWLPAAMAAPTPVSSLVHSSTLVTAGVYLLIRFSNSLKLNSLLMELILFTGLLTMLMAGFSASCEFDIKKIIAFSTLSQLGLMMMIYGMMNFYFVFFHLIIHAMFKSMMFMCSGIYIHSLLGFQDIRYMGKLIKIMPLTSVMFLISNFALMGIPFFSGFYSKDQILEFVMFMNFNFKVYLLMMISTGMTVFYSFRLAYYLFNSKFNFLMFFKINDFKKMNYPLYLLMFMSIMFGMIMNWMIFLSVESCFFEKMEKLMILLVCLVFMLLMILLMNFKNKYLFYKIKYFFGDMWFLYNLNKLILNNSFFLGKLWFLSFDKGWSEYIYKKSIMDMLDKFYYYLNMKNLVFLMMVNIYVVMMIFIIFN